MKNRIYILLIALVFVSCTRNDSVIKKYDYPNSKLWKHGVYSKYDAQKLESIFEGLEVDVIYSPEQHNIYVGRVLADTSNRLFLDDWFAMLESPNKMHYWIDFKNLSEKNAQQALDVLNALDEKYKIKENAFVENKSVDALKIVKENGFHTLLWVENLNYWKTKQHKDSVYLVKLIRSQIEDLQPDAISCEYTLHQLLCDSFPEQNIHLWDTPKKYTPENVEFTKKLCAHESVKVVLVDYPTDEIF